ncbi:MAG: alpha/beta hydrolase [Candidatus Saccharibacteria bacterium]
MAKTPPNPLDYIFPLNMNGLQGRMMQLAAPKGRSREIMLVYGHHSSLERWFGLAQVLNRYGTVTVPDLPGFGGMESFYKIDKKPTIDNLADYLAAFVKMRYKRRRVTIIGMSFGFVVATRMLQRFPDLAKKVEILVSLVGFAHKDDFTFSPIRSFSYRLGATVFSLPIASNFFRGVCLHPAMLRLVYAKTSNAKHKFADLTPAQRDQMLDVEIGLWRNNDVRTYMYTTTQFLTFDNCKSQINLPVWHVGVKNDHFFDNNLVEQHMRVIFTDFHGMTINMTKHAPTVIAEAKDAAPFVPPKLRRVLSQPSSR